MTTPRQPTIRIVARYVVPALLFAATGAILAVALRDALSTPREAVVVPVAIAPSMAATDGAGGGLQAPGWIEPAPFATDVPALRAGTVSEVLVLEGARVARGDAVARLDDAAERVALRLADAEVSAADAAVDLAAATLAAAERTLTLATDAARALRVAEAEVGEAAAMVARAAAEFTEADAMHRDARDAYERKSLLVATGGAAEGEVRRLGLQADALRAKLEAVRAEGTAREARLAAAIATRDAASVVLRGRVEETRARDEARASLAAAKATRDARSAMRDAAALALERSTVVAPCDGTVLVRHARPGSRAGGEMPVLTLYEPASLQVRCDVPLRDAARLSIGLRAEIRVDALGDRVFAGRVTRIVPLGDLQKNTVQCKVAIESPDEALKPDMLARVRILDAAHGADGGAARGAEGVLAPEDALRRLEDGRVQVLVAVPDGRAARTELREIALGPARANGWVEVSRGLSAGDRVVTDATVGPGERIAPREKLREAAP
ncbi:MAG: efflux RND transporter periplasmic adaptor subunit [Planctomycetota bacterium]